MFYRKRNVSDWRERRWNWSTLWSKYKLECLFVMALILTALLGGYSMHPGTHVAGVLIVLDLLVWRITKRPRMGRILGFTLLNVVGIIIILVAKDPVELWFAGLCGVYAVLILVSELTRAKS